MCVANAEHYVTRVCYQLSNLAACSRGRMSMYVVYVCMCAARHGSVCCGVGDMYLLTTGCAANVQVSTLWQFTHATFVGSK